LRTSRADDQTAELRRWNVFRKQMERAGLSIPAQMPRVPYPLLQELATQGMGRARHDNSTTRPLVPFGFWNGSSKSAGRWLELLRTTNALNECDIPDTVPLQGTREFTQPILLIFGEQSRWIECCRILSNSFPNCRTVIVPKAGHFHPIQYPRQFATHVNNFLLGDHAI
jgi:pimeloyl-ACP methyl ester carboxylesterase